jgi:hypothetical protein
MECLKWYNYHTIAKATSIHSHRWQRYREHLTLYRSWLIDYLLFYAMLKEFFTFWRRHHYQWRAAKPRPMLGAQVLWARRDLYCATLAVTRGLGFSSLIRRTTRFNRLLRLARGRGGPILTWIIYTGPHSLIQLVSIIPTILCTTVDYSRTHNSRDDRDMSYTE